MTSQRKWWESAEMANWIEVRNQVYCDAKRSPQSTILCETCLSEEWRGDDGVWHESRVEHPARNGTLLHAGRGRAGQWFFWESPEKEERHG